MFSCSKIAALLLVTVTATAGSTSIKPRLKTAVESDNVLIVCANQTVTTNIFWEKNDTSSSFRQNGTLLKFIHVNRISAGVYVCYSINSTGDGSKEMVDAVELDVQYPAEVTNFSITPTTVTENSSFTITCTIVGNPPPSYTIPSGPWTRKWHNTSKTSDTITVTIRDAQCEDGRKWGCSVRNKLNTEPIWSEGINVTVFCVAKPTKSYSDWRYHAGTGLGQDVQFEMDNVGYPYPNYTWSFNGTALPRSMHEDVGWLSILKIPSVRMEDFGNYTLTMSNSVGSYVANYELHPSGPPIPPKNLKFSNITSEGATISWVSGFDMWRHQTFVIYRYIHSGTAFASIDFINGSSENHGYNIGYTYVITTLDPGTDYKITVASQSPGSVSYTNDIFFKTKGSAPRPVNAGVQTVQWSVSGLLLVVFQLMWFSANRALS